MDSTMSSRSRRLVLGLVTIGLLSIAMALATAANDSGRQSGASLQAAVARLGT